MRSEGRNELRFFIAYHSWKNIWLALPFWACIDWVEHICSTGFYGLSSFILIYDFSSPFSFSSCQWGIHFACVTSSLSLRAINLSLNYHSRHKLRGPPLSSGSWLVLITLSLPYHTLWSLALSESYCLRQEVRGRRGIPPSPHPTVNPISFSASLHHLSNPFSRLHWPAPSFSFWPPE